MVTGRGGVLSEFVVCPLLVLCGKGAAGHEFCTISGPYQTGVGSGGLELWYLKQGGPNCSGHVAGTCRSQGKDLVV